MVATGDESRMAKRLFPTLAGYRREWVGPDVLAGLAAAAVVIPQAMAYATIANLPVQLGLYTCMVPMLVYAMLGGSRALSMSTTSTIATLTATTLVSSGVAAASDNPMGDLVMLTLLVGVILLVARAFRVGTLVENVNKSAILGIQVGVGVTVAVGQLPRLLGSDDNLTGHGLVASFHAVVAAVPNVNVPTVLLSAASIAVLFVFRFVWPRMLGPIVVAVGGILLIAFTGLADAGVAVITPVTAGLPLPRLPSLEHVPILLPGAFAIAIMAFLESATVARTIRRVGEKQIDSNQELLATSVAHAAGSFFLSLPSAGGLSQSSANQQAGAKSQLATLVTLALAVLTALFLGPVISLLPIATLASIVFVAVIGLVDVRSLVRLARVSHGDFWTAIVTALAGLIAGLLVSVAVAVVITLGLVLHELNRVRVVRGEQRRGTLEVKIGPLYTANVLESELAIIALAEQSEGVNAIVIDLHPMIVTSLTVLNALADLDGELAVLGIELRIADMPARAQEIALKTTWFQGLVANQRVFSTVEEAFAGPLR